MDIKKLLRPLFSKFVLRSEFEAREESLREQMRQYVELRQELDSIIGMLRQENQNLSQELANAIDMLRQENRNLRQELANSVEMLRNEDKNLNYDTYTRLLLEAQKHFDETRSDMVAFLMKTRLVLARQYNNLTPTEAADQTTSKAEPFEVYLEKFKNLYPNLYDIWASVNFGINIEEFKERPEASCGVETRLTAQHFQSFVAPYLKGQVLDVGCGPYPVPLYLKDYPNELISGIDPLEPFEPHPFAFVRGFAEFLPWDDSTFDVVIAATSLDHVLSLELALSEIRRVLKPGGIFLVWEWFSDNAMPYNPSEQAPQLIDRYHLFNFDEKWFEEIMIRHFSIEEKFRLSGEWNHYYYYALKLRYKE